MIYETEIKIKDFIIEIEFDSNTEEFSYQIKERKKANAKTQSKEKTDNTGTNNDTGTDNTGTDAPPDEFEQLFK